MNPNQTNVDIFSMSDEEFTAWEQGSLVQDDKESASADSFITESEETLDQTQEVVNEEEEYIEPSNTDEEVEDDSNGFDDTSEEDIRDEQTDGTDDNGNEDEVETSDFDYQSEYNRLIGTPIKANGKEITLDNMDDAIKLIQMGANYYKKVEQLKPAQKIIAMLENNNMLDEDKLNYAIDLLNKNPQAINKLIGEAGESFEQDEDQAKDYKPTNYEVSESRIAVDNALKEISSTPTYTRTVQVLGSDWDNASREIINSNPEVIQIINEHMSSGLFDTVSQEVEKRKMLGTIPQGLSDIQAYKLVGDSLYAQAVPTEQGQQSANVNPPIRKPNRETVVSQKKAASVPRAKPSTNLSNQLVDVYSMSDEDFMKRYGN